MARSKNLLFNYIQFNLIEIQKLLPSGIQLQQDTTVKEKIYYRFDLIVEPFHFSLGEKYLQLKANHLSVYQYQDYLSQSEMSQYHYTAAFKDNNGTNYILHVHFNEKDLLTKSPILEKRQKESIERLEIKEIENLLLFFAKIKTEKLIHFLKENFEKKVIFLKKESQLCQLKAAIYFEKEDLEKYLTELDQLTSFYKELNLLVNDSSYKAQVQLIKQIKNNLQTKVKPTEAVEIEELTPSFEIDDSLKINIRPLRQPDSDSISSSLIKLKKIYNSYPAENTKELMESAKELADLYGELNQLTFFANPSMATQNEINELMKIKAAVYGKLEFVFIHLIFNKKWIQLKENPIFKDFISLNYLNLALVQKNSELLDFILSSNCNLANRPVLIGNKEYKNAAVYCFYQTVHNNDLLSCFDVLCKHNLFSILATVESDSGNLPLAYLLLSTRVSPLAIKLSQLLEQPAAASSFWPQFKTAMEIQLNTMDRIKDSKKIEAIESNMKLFEISYKKQSSKFSRLPWESIGKAINEDLARNLRGDKEISDLAKKLNILCEDYIKRIPIKKRIHNIKANNALAEEVINSFDFKNMEFAEAKKLVKQHLNESILTINAAIEKNSIEKKLKNPIYSSKPSRKTKKTVQQEKGLIHMIHHSNNNFFSAGAVASQNKLAALRDQRGVLMENLLNVQESMEKLKKVQKLMEDLVEELEDLDTKQPKK